MLVIQISRHCSEQILTRQWEVKGKRTKLRKALICFHFLRWSQVMTEEMSFQVSLWKLSGIQHSGWGWEVHSTSQELWKNTFWKVISVMAPRGVARSQISDFLRGCRLSLVNGTRRVLSLWLFYLQASVSWTWCELQQGVWVLVRVKERLLREGVRGLDQEGML